MNLGKVSIKGALARRGVDVEGGAKKYVMGNVISANAWHKLQPRQASLGAGMDYWSTMLLQ